MPEKEDKDKLSACGVSESNQDAIEQLLAAELSSELTQDFIRWSIRQALRYGAYNPFDEKHQECLVQHRTQLCDAIKRVLLLSEEAIISQRVSDAQSSSCISPPPITAEELRVRLMAVFTQVLMRPKYKIERSILLMSPIVINFVNKFSMPISLLKPSEASQQQIETIKQSVQGVKNSEEYITVLGNTLMAVTPGVTTLPDDISTVIEELLHQLNQYNDDKLGAILQPQFYGNTNILQLLLWKVSQNIWKTSQSIKGFMGKLKGFASKNKCELWLNQNFYGWSALHFAIGFAPPDILLEVLGFYQKALGIDALKRELSRMVCVQTTEAILDCEAFDMLDQRLELLGSDQDSLRAKRKELLGLMDIQQEIFRLKEKTDEPIADDKHIELCLKRCTDYAEKYETIFQDKSQIGCLLGGDDAVCKKYTYFAQHLALILESIIEKPALLKQFQKLLLRLKPDDLYEFLNYRSSYDIDKMIILIAGKDPHCVPSFFEKLSDDHKRELATYNNDYNNNLLDYILIHFPDVSKMPGTLKSTIGYLFGYESLSSILGLINATFKASFDKHRSIPLLLQRCVAYIKVYPDAINDERDDLYELVRDERHGYTHKYLYLLREIFLEIISDLSGRSLEFFPKFKEILEYFGPQRLCDLLCTVHGYYAHSSLSHVSLLGKIIIACPKYVPVLLDLLDEQDRRDIVERPYIKYHKNNYYPGGSIGDGICREYKVQSSLTILEDYHVGHRDVRTYLLNCSDPCKWVEELGGLMKPSLQQADGGSNPQSLRLKKESAERSLERGQKIEILLKRLQDYSGTLSADFKSAMADSCRTFLWFFIKDIDYKYYFCYLEKVLQKYELLSGDIITHQEPGDISVLGGACLYERWDIVKKLLTLLNNVQNLEARILQDDGLLRGKYNNWGMLHVVAALGMSDLLKKLLEARVKEGEILTDYHGRSVLHYAVVYENILSEDGGPPFVETLLVKFGDLAGEVLAQVDEYGWMAIDLLLVGGVNSNVEELWRQKPWEMLHSDCLMKGVRDVRYELYIRWCLKLKESEFKSLGLVQKGMLGRHKKEVIKVANELPLDDSEEGMQIRANLHQIIGSEIDGIDGLVRCERPTTRGPFLGTFFTTARSGKEDPENIPSAHITDLEL
jgi:hypothetical protein